MNLKLNHPAPHRKPRPSRNRRLSAAFGVTPSYYSREPALLDDFARAAVITRVSVARVYLGLALLAVVAGGARARVLLLATWRARGAVLARIREAHVALGEHLASHGTWESKARLSDTRLLVRGLVGELFVLSVIW